MAAALPFAVDFAVAVAAILLPCRIGTRIDPGIPLVVLARQGDETKFKRRGAGVCTGDKVAFFPCRNPACPLGWLRKAEVSLFIREREFRAAFEPNARAAERAVAVPDTAVHGCCLFFRWLFRRQNSSSPAAAGQNQRHASQASRPKAMSPGHGSPSASRNAKGTRGVATFASVPGLFGSVLREGRQKKAGARRRPEEVVRALSSLRALRGKKQSPLSGGLPTSVLAAGSVREAGSRFLSGNAYSAERSLHVAARPVHCLARRRGADCRTPGPVPVRVSQRLPGPRCSCFLHRQRWHPAFADVFIGPPSCGRHRGAARLPPVPHRKDHAHRARRPSAGGGTRNRRQANHYAARTGTWPTIRRPRPAQRCGTRRRDARP